MFVKKEFLKWRPKYYFVLLTNHNVETCKVKRKEDLIVVVSKVITPHIKVQRLIVRYFCHICSDTGHKIIDCPKYNGM